MTLKVVDSSLQAVSPPTGGDSWTFRITDLVDVSCGPLGAPVGRFFREWTRHETSVQYSSS